jgi:hypothetical protein
MGARLNAVLDFDNEATQLHKVNRRLLIYDLYDLDGLIVFGLPLMESRNRSARRHPIDFGVRVTQKEDERRSWTLQ